MLFPEQLNHVKHNVIFEEILFVLLFLTFQSAKVYPQQKYLLTYCTNLAVLYHQKDGDFSHDLFHQFPKQH